MKEHSLTYRHQLALMALQQVQSSLEQTPVTFTGRDTPHRILLRQQRQYMQRITRLETQARRRGIKLSTLATCYERWF